MTLEGTLDDFGLADVFQLLSSTKKTGTLHLRRGQAHGAVHLRDGQITGARSDVRRQALGRRLVGAGLVDEATLAHAVGRLPAGGGLARLLADRAGVDPQAACDLAAEQATDAVFDLLRWFDGRFSFAADELDPDDLGAALPVDAVVAEARRRLATWEHLITRVPGPDAVVRLAPAPAEPPSLSLDEWQLLSVLDGRRTVAELAVLTGQGDYAVVSALAALVERGLLQVDDDGADVLSRRQELLDRLEAAADAEPAHEQPVPVPYEAPVLPEPPVPQQPPTPVLPEPPEPPAPVLPDPSIDRTLLLRLIAGVKGL